MEDKELSKLIDKIYTKAENGGWSDVELSSTETFTDIAHKIYALGISSAENNDSSKQTCIECGYPVNEDEPVKNCHSNCRIEL